MQVNSEHSEKNSPKSLHSSQKRTFSHHQKDDCWNKAALMIGRDPERWRLDAMGNPVCKLLRGCMGPLCHEYDHVIPFSKGGKTEINNCQILQTTLNRVKSNRMDISYNELKTISPNLAFSEMEFDAVEKAIYGNVNKIQQKEQ